MSPDSDKFLEPLEFKTRLRLERKRHRLSQETFARMGGVTKTSQYLYETGSHWPTVEYLEKLRINKVDVCYLATGNRNNRGVVDWDILREAFINKQQALCISQGIDIEKLFDDFKKEVVNLALFKHPSSSN